jgi:hypothetical protein
MKAFLLVSICLLLSLTSCAIHTDKSSADTTYSLDSINPRK